MVILTYSPSKLVTFSKEYWKAMDTSISDATAACRACISLLKTDFAETCSMKFDYWAYKYGASSKPSLDLRLVLDPKTRDYILNTLQQLVVVFQEYKELALSGTSVPPPSTSGVDDKRLTIPWWERHPAHIFIPGMDYSKPNSLDDPVASPLQIVENDILLMLDLLENFTIGILQSNALSSVQQRADKQFEPQKHMDLQQYLVTILLTRLGHSTEQIDASKLSEVQQRLIHCNLKRYNRFLYAREHSSTSPQTVESGSPTIDTGDSASVLDSSPTLTWSGSSPSSSIEANRYYPRPPKIKEGARDFTCPCCYELLPVDYAEENMWIMHVADDLRPYTCIVPNCKTPYVLFATEKKWKTHMFEEHRTLWYWRCFDCGKGENDGVPFDNENAFIEHTKTKHLHRPGIRSYEFRIKAEMSRRPEIVCIKSCPLCNWSEGKGKEDKPVNQKALLDHIAQDLHSFSLCAFPVAGDDGWQRNIERESLSVDRVDEWCADNLARCSLEKELSGYRQTLRNISGHF